MTEYEIAQLEIMQTERNMSVFDAITSTLGLVQNDFTQWLALLFGYLLVAYFIGASLTRIQVVILNVLYLASVGYMTLSILAGIKVAQALIAYFEVLTGVSSDSMLMNPTTASAGMALLLALILASLYFMWGIRHPKPE